MKIICVRISTAVLPRLVLLLICGVAFGGYACFGTQHSACAEGNCSVQETILKTSSSVNPASWSFKSVFVPSTGRTPLPIAQLPQPAAGPEAESDFGWDSHELSKNIGGAGAVLFVIFGVIVFSRRKKSKQ